MSDVVSRPAHHTDSASIIEMLADVPLGAKREDASQGSQGSQGVGQRMFEWAIERAHEPARERARERTRQKKRLSGAIDPRRPSHQRPGLLQAPTSAYKRRGGLHPLICGYEVGFVILEKRQAR